MTRDPFHIYAFDDHLDNSRQWQAGSFDCYRCGFEFVYTCRVDGLPVTCPRCVASSRWKRKPIYQN